MKHKKFQQTFQSVVSFVLILFLLPYVVTILMHGSGIQVSGGELNSAVNVRVTQEDGSEQTIAVPWEEFFLGALAREIPENSEMEFVKAQAVLLRTNVYRTLENADNPVLDELFLSKAELEKKCMNLSDSAYYSKLKQAMTETGQEVLFFGETYATVPFHQSSNGATRNYKEVTGQEGCPYVVVRECPLDKEAEEEKQVYTFEYKDVQKKCQSLLVAVEKNDAEKL